MLLKRWLTALILLPLLIILLLKGSQELFSFIVGLVTVAALAEYFKIVSGGSLKTISIKTQVIAYLTAIAIIAAAHSGVQDLILAIVALNLVLLSLAVMMDYSSESTILTSVAKQIQGIIYIPVFLSFLVTIRNSDNGAVWIIWLWLMIAASDTGAFYCGSYYGKRPFFPRLSPKKTVEGALGGIASAVVVGLCFHWLFIPGISSLMVIFFAATAAAAGQVGDLFESALKRAGGIKDSGWILPGHGGILDRIDAVIFALPVAWVFKALL